MPVHPIEFRYSFPEMYCIFTEETKLQYWLEVEAALAWAHAKLGTIPRAAAEEIALKAKVGTVKVERVKKIEEETRHDLLAMVYALQEVCEGDAGGYIHLGATSYDIEDTALALQLRKATDVLEGDLKALLGVLLDKAETHRETVCIGRTHGQHALPTTYGMKFALWAAEVSRHLDRLDEVRKRILVGKMSGAVGTMASFGDKGFDVQRLTMERLGLEPAMITNQIIQRDRHAELQCFLGLTAGTLDKIGRELRNLQRTEIAEISEEARSPSSTMPQKRNPSNTERICGLARVVRGSVASSLESIALEHERDISNSSLERINIPEGFILTDYMLRQMTQILKELSFDEENIERNLNMTLGLCLTERVMLELVGKGVGRQEAHELMRRLAMKCWKEKRSLKEIMLEDAQARKLVTTLELDDWLNPKSYLGTAVAQVDRVVATLRKRLREVPMKLYAARILEERGINYRVIELSDRALSIDDVIRFSKEPLMVDEICKTIIVKDRDGKKYAILLLGNDRVDFAKAGKVIGSKLSIADPREVKEATGVEPGAVCPLLLKIPVYIDRRVTEKKRVNFGSGNHLYGIDMAFQDLAMVFEYTVVDVAEG